ncbi:hypothetical protein ACLG6S_15050 [Thermodesulfobacteriota bacterium B35]
MTPDDRGRPQDPYWDIKRSIANAIARSPKPSLLRLHNDVLEEFGYRPDLELVDYFCSIAEIPEEEVADYFCRIALPSDAGGEAGEEAAGKCLADRIATEPEPTILKFRTEYENRFESAPPEELLRYFLEKMQANTRGKAAAAATGEETDFAMRFAATEGATVLMFRKEYQRKYGREPSEELTRFFLQKKQQAGKGAGPAGRTPGEPSGGDTEEDSRVNFARTVANGLVTTVLQFRKIYEKVYGESPPPELIEVFLKSLPRN